jgi:ABC-2 type transport system ATP-binding protein
MNQKAGTLSRGLRQRLAVAQAIIHEPKVVLLDEPAAGLDPEARHELSGVLRQLRDGGITLVVSSHILAELEDYSTDMLMLGQGRVIEHRPIAAPAAGGKRRMRAVLATQNDRLGAVLGAIDGISGLRVEEREAAFDLPDDPQRQHAVLKLLIAADLPVISFGPERADLQDAYLARMRTAVRA